MTEKYLSWFGIVRLGLVQAALGGIVVLTTSTINRLMIVELALPALVPGLLVTWHYALQILRPRWGYGSDRGARRTPWIIGGMFVLAVGGVLAAASVGLTASSTILGLSVAFIAFTLIGIGVGASGTSLLIFLASHVERERRAAAATIVWIMMIVGIHSYIRFCRPFPRSVHTTSSRYARIDNLRLCIFDFACCALSS